MPWLPIIFAIACQTADPKDQVVDSGLQVEPVCETPVPLACVDEMILDLSLHDDLISTGTVSSSLAGSDWISGIDASAGGMQESSNNPWVYVQFNDDGLERIEIDDETALESMDWDMAFRRFIIRLNGGSSGPSCVAAAALFEADYDSLDAVEEAVVFATDEYYTEDCTIINDSSGLPNSPQVVLGSWWEYPGCVATTEIPHLVRLANGRVLKLVVESYYGLGQEDCNQNGAPGEHSARIQIRWQFLN